MIGLSGFINNTSQDYYKIDFRLIKNESKIKKHYRNESQFCADVKLININHPTIKMLPIIEYGFKTSIEAFYIEAFTLDDKEIDISTSADYDWFSINIDLISFSPGDTICDKICSSGIYEIKEKGIYKLRLVFDPDKYFKHKGDINGEIIYSNWDTITIK